MLTLIKQTIIVAPEVCLTAYKEELAKIIK